jgi:RNA polymerase sigma-70 factor (ECF subfamily)
MTLVCEGSREALASLFSRYARAVRGVAYQVLRDASEADDLLQDIFLLVHRLCGTFDSSKGPARFWILQMTYRRAISRRRYLTSRHFYTSLDLDQAANQLGDVPAKSGRHEDSMDTALEREETLQRWLVNLSEGQRQTLHLFFFEGCTFEEIAAKLGQTVGNARNHYYRGLDRLRKQISAGKLPGKEAV